MITIQRLPAICAMTTALLTAFNFTPAFAQMPSITAGANMDIDFNEELQVQINRFSLNYSLEVNLNHDPGAGPMFKLFESPINDTGLPILLDSLQPFPLTVWEDFHVLGEPVADWHEEIVTAGWEWVLPGDTRFPTLFPDGQSLITKNGDPHPWQFTPFPAVLEPHRVDVMFPPIGPGETLDIHKALLWVGTSGNRIWGDDVLDDGSAYDESRIRVWEYPTVPEPSTMCIVVFAVLPLLAHRR